MRDKILAVILSVALLLSLMPVTAVASEAWTGGQVQPAAGDGSPESPYEIETGAELAWLANEVNTGKNSLCAVLTDNIDLGNQEWTPIGNSSNQYRGTFDGAGFTITGLSINQAEETHQGLFGYVFDATITNLAVEGAVTGGGAATTGGVGGLVGSFGGTYGKSGLIENCVSNVTVIGKYNAGGIVGFITSNSDKLIQNCTNLGSVTANNSAGGLVGQFYSKGTVRNCYNRGDVAAVVSKAGGIAGYMDSYTAIVENCYTTGAVSGSDSGSGIGKKTSGSITNCYALAADGYVTAKTEEEMKSPAFLTALGDGFIRDVGGLNGGYPILPFQDPTPKYTLTLTVSPADAEVLLEDGEHAQVAGSSAAGPDSTIYTFQVPDGSYTYTVSAYGKKTASSAISVSGAPVSESVTLEDQTAGRVQFQISPAGAEAVAQITVTQDGREISETEGIYLLYPGECDYVVRAKGYAKIEATLTVTDPPEETMTVELTMVPSVAWDGESTDKPQGEGTESAPYQIGTGEELAWFAEQVNSGTARAAHAQLTADIDLGGENWTSIGKSYSNYYSGQFDGAGYTVKGLSVRTDSGYAGLFGSVMGSSGSPAKIKNVTISGEVNDSSSGGYIGGVVGYATYAELENCHNRAAVTAAGSARNVGGIAGYLYDGGSIRSCSNSGTITAESSENVGGILGYNSGFKTATAIYNSYNSGSVAGKTKVGGVIGNMGANVLDVYNTGSVTGMEAVGGLAGYQGSDISNGYTVGPVSGAQDAHTAFGRASSTYSRTNIFYLNSLPADANAEAKTESELKSLAGTLGANWKPDGVGSSSVNGGYPVLGWQELNPGPVKLATPGNPVWKADERGLLTPVATWSPVENAQSYTVCIWEYWVKEEGNVTTSGVDRLKTIPGLTQTEYDFTGIVTENGASWYYFTVTAVGDGQYADSEESEIDPFNEAGCLRYTNQLEPPTGLRWTGHVANWGFVDFAEGYLVAVYRLDDGGNPSYVAGGIVNGGVNSLDCRNYFAVGGRYVFQVSALSEEYVTTGNTEKNSEFSKMSNAPEEAGENGVHTAVSIPEPDPDDEDDTGWELITTAEQLIDLANVEDVPVDRQGTSLQAVEWAKKYRLKGDIDFSKLSAEYEAKSKSIGNVQNRFTGVLDGNGYKLTGLTLSNHDAGLFEYIGAEGLVYDLTIEGANVQFSDNAAVLAMNNYGTVLNCAVINTNITSDVGAVMGGMVSRNYGVIRNSYVLGGKLTSNSTTATGHAGFVGSNETGGLIECCYTTMSVQTASDYAGGFVGLCYEGTIRNCFALGDVSARAYSGGFAGRSVYSGNVYENCYASNHVTVAGEEGNGFIGGSKPDSAFHPDLSKEIKNCFYNSDTGPADKYAGGKTGAELKSSAFLNLLSGTSGIWSQSPEKNDGLPFLSSVTPPSTIPTSKLQVQIALGTYNRETYAFQQMGETFTVTLDGTGNTTVIEVLEQAAKQGLLSYEYATTSYGRYIRSLNGYAVEPPDGWMFTVNDKLSNLGASLAKVQDGDRLLWFEGTTENRFQGPTWEELVSGGAIEWTEIGSVQALQALCASTDAQTLAKNYRLTADLDLQGAEFKGIGSSQTPFTGVFDGQNHKISNFTISGGENVGLFNVICGATVKNLKVAGASVSGTKNVGVLVGWAQAVLDKSDLSGSHANLVGNCSVSGTVAGEQSVGGLMGRNGGKYDQDTLFSSYSSVDRCTSDVVVTGQGASCSEIGGLAGVNEGYITRSSASGTVTAATGSLVGGLTGSNHLGIYDSHASGAVSGVRAVGGFTGSAGADSTIRGCYSTGDAAATEGNVGGFAGSLAGEVEDSMSAGTVTPGTGLSGYSGGFVGSFSGTLTGLDNQITLKNCFGNCLGKEGNLKPIGNSSQYPGEGNEAAMAEIALNTLRDVSGKLFEMFGVNLDAGLEAEAGRYADWITISYDTPLEKDIPLLKEAQTATPGVTAAISVQSGYLTDGESLQLSRKNETARSLTCQGTLTVSDGQSFFHKPVTILLKASAQARDRLMDAIAETLTESSDGWTVMDLAAYGRLPGKTAATGEAALQNAVNLAIGEAAGSPLPGDRARLEIVLRSIGVDSAKLYQVNSNIPIDNAAKLKNVSASGLTAYGYYSAPWILMAELQGNVELTQDQRTALLYLLRDSMGEDGMFAAEYNGVVYPDVDTAGITLAALASLYESDETAKLIVDTILAGLPSVQSASGSFGSANTDAMVLLGLSAMGIDPLTDSRFMKNGCSVADGLLTYVNAAENGFQFGGAENALATEQGFRALVALAQRGETAGAYQFYDFSGVPVQPGRATGEGEVEKPDEPDTDQTITVSFMLKSDSEIWIPRTQVTVKKGSTVYHAFVKALEDAGLTSVGAENGYVKSITKDGVTLSEFDKGPDSGWLYKVDGRVPTVGLTSYPLSGGENILWYYTRDWTADPDAGVIDGGKTDEKQDQVLTPDMTAGQDGSGRASVSTGELSRAAEQAAKTGGAVVIAPKGADQVEKLTVTLPGDAAAKLAEAGAELRVETKAADVTLSQAGLRQLSQAAKEITVETECLEGGGIALSLRADGNEVSPVDGGVKVVLPVKNGQVVVLLEDGGETVVKKSLVEDGKAYALLPSGATLKVVDRPVSYGDVTAGQWFASAVQFAAGRGLMAGVTESQFAPDLNMDRGMLVTVLHRLEEEPRGDGPAFGDVLKDSYYAEAVAWAAEQGIVSGMAPNVFAPADPVTREQLAAFLHRYAKLAGLDVADRADLGKFADAAAVSDWAKESLEWAVSVGLLAGKDSGLLDPTGNATRAEVAIILQRLIALLVK